MAFSQQAQQQAVQTGAESRIAIAGQVEVVVHIMVTYGAVGMNKTWVDIEEAGIGEQRHFGLQQFVDSPVLLPQRVRIFTPRKQTQHHHTGLGLLLVDKAHNRFYATNHLLCCVTVVVGAHPDDHDLWSDVLQLPILQTPEYVLSGIAPNAEVESVEGGEEFPPGLELVEKLHQRVTNEDNLRLLVFAVSNKAMVL